MARRMTLRSNLACCGLSEINGLRRYATPEEAMEAFAEIAEKRRWRHIAWASAPFEQRRGRAFVIFTGVEQAKYHTRFASLIRREKLGRLTTLAPVNNPNSGNMLKAYLWAPDWAKVNEWAKARKEASRAAVGD